MKALMILLLSVGIGRPVFAQSRDSLLAAVPVLPTAVARPVSPQSSAPRPAPRRRVKDSPVQGIIIGAIAGAMWCAYICGQGGSEGEFPLIILTGAGFGALIGGSIDAYTQRGAVLRTSF